MICICSVYSSRILSMSRTGELLRRLQGPTSDQEESALAKRAETSQLWPRFTKAFDAIARAFGEQPPPQGINREFTTFDWNGVDEGIHDHNGFINGRINGIDLQIKLKGTTIDDQQQYAILPDGKWQLQHSRERYVFFKGTFVSADGRKGAVEMQHKNDTWLYKAFWLETRNGFLQLEQVVGPDGVIYDAGKLEQDKKEVTIPGTRTSVTRFKT